MDAEQFYRTWAPPDALWSDWVAPALFVQIECGDVESDLGEADVSCLPERLPERAAVVLDLPGAEAVRLGVHLATTAGYRPVPLINASPGPLQDASDVCVVDMTELVHALCAAMPAMTAIQLMDDAPPVFILDESRSHGARPAEEGTFDNRWLVFPQDFPSASFLHSHGITDVVLVQKYGEQPQEDLAHVLLRWQEAGIRIHGRNGAVIRVRRPSRFRALWYRALATLGLRRNRAGGFGSYVPEHSGAG